MSDRRDGWKQTELSSAVSRALKKRLINFMVFLYHGLICILH